jgi:hypothetical protein
MPALGLGDEASDSGQGVGNVFGEKGQSAEDGNRDHCEHDAILRHRLPVLAVSERREQVEKPQHLFRLPSAVTREGKRTTVRGFRADEKQVELFGHAGGTSVLRLGVAAPPVGSVATQHRPVADGPESLASVIPRDVPYIE